MTDVEILERYLQRRFKGRVDSFIESPHPRYSNLRMYVGRNTVEFWINDGNVIVCNYQPSCKITLHMADPDFEVKLYVFLTDTAGVKPSKLKAEY